MIYHMRKIVSHLDDVPLPTCMYRLKNINYFDDDTMTNECSSEPDLKIKEQIPCKKMAELEKRQDHLLQQLDVLYERIKSLSTLCKLQPTTTITQPQPSAAVRKAKKPLIAAPVEILINANANYLPYFLLVLAKGPLNNQISLTYHIHSSVPVASVAKIKQFMKLVNTESLSGPTKVTLIFKDVAANMELKLSLAGVPIVGEVNILRYLGLVFPDAVPYDESVHVDSLLDHCYLLQRTQDECALQRILSSYKGDWILGEQFSIVDLAAFSCLKQMEPIPPKVFRFVPKPWFHKVNQLLK